MGLGRLSTPLADELVSLFTSIPGPVVRASYLNPSTEETAINLLIIYRVPMRTPPAQLHRITYLFLPVAEHERRRHQMLSKPTGVDPSLGGFWTCSPATTQMTRG